MDFIYSSSGKILKQNNIFNKSVLEKTPVIRASILDKN